MLFFVAVESFGICDVVYATYKYVIVWNFVVCRHCQENLEVYTTIMSYFVIIKNIDDLFIQCHLRVKVFHERQIVVMKGEYMPVKGECLTRKEKRQIYVAGGRYMRRKGNMFARENGSLP